jgi:small subunit ribosomal protein S18
MAEQRKSGGRSRRRKSLIPVQRHCFFCTNHIDEPDYKDTELLGRFISSFKKIAPRRRSGLCAGHQRKMAIAVKRSREMALLPYIPE